MTLLDSLKIMAGYNRPMNERDRRVWAERWWGPCPEQVRNVPLTEPDLDSFLPDVISQRPEFFRQSWVGPLRLEPQAAERQRGNGVGLLGAAPLSQARCC